MCFQNYFARGALQNNCEKPKASEDAKVLVSFTEYIMKYIFKFVVALSVLPLYVQRIKDAGENKILIGRAALDSLIAPPPNCIISN